MEFNSTLFIQAGIYLALFFILKKLYFGPLINLLKKRDELTVGKMDESTELAKKIETLSAQYEADMKRAREEIESQRQETLRRVRTSAEEKIHDAKSKVEKKLSEFQDSLDKESKNIRTKFPAMSTELQKEIIGAILNSKVVQL